MGLDGLSLDETVAFRCYLCVAKMSGILAADNLGSEGPYDDTGLFNAHIEELFDSDIDEIIYSQHVRGVFGKQKWAFADPDNGYQGDDLRARVFHDRDYDLYYLANRPTASWDDKMNDFLTAIGLGTPDMFVQAAQLVELVKPQFRQKLVLTGASLGGGLSAYAATKAPWPVATLVFDPLGLNQSMLTGRGPNPIPRREVVTERVRHMDDHVDWYYIAGSWVANSMSSVG